VGQFSFKYCPQSPKTSSAIYHGHTLGCWLVTPPPLSVFVTFPTLGHWEFSSLPHPVLQGRFSVPPHLSTVGVRLQFTVYSFQLCWGWGSICPGIVLDYAPRGWLVELCVVHVVHLLGLQVYAGSFETGWWAEMVCCFSQGRHFLGLGSVWQGIGRVSTC
jgi:hypothetical protein